MERVQWQSREFSPWRCNKILKWVHVACHGGNWHGSVTSLHGTATEKPVSAHPCNTFSICRYVPPVVPHVFLFSTVEHTIAPPSRRQIFRAGGLGVLQRNVAFSRHTGGQVPRYVARPGTQATKNNASRVSTVDSKYGETGEDKVAPRRAWDGMPSTHRV